MNDAEIRLECLRMAGGDIDHATKIYNFVTNQKEGAKKTPSKKKLTQKKDF